MFKYNGRQYFRSGTRVQVADTETNQWITDQVDEREQRAAFDALTHHDKAMAYAWGHEDATGTKTFEHKNRIGCNEFAEAFAVGYFEYNLQKRYYMTNIRDAYDAWQRSNGHTIFRDESRKADTN